MKIIEETPYRFRIEQEGAMRVPGIVFASRSSLPDEPGDMALAQVADVATLPGIVRAGMRRRSDSSFAGRVGRLQPERGDRGIGWHHSDLLCGAGTGGSGSCAPPYTYSDARVQVTQGRYALREPFTTRQIGHSRP